MIKMIRIQNCTSTYGYMLFKKTVACATFKSKLDHCFIITCIRLSALNALFQ